ncbi:hypothetical protein BJ165DRAFT_1597466 [Panaeolus papilionaceus]|nr:hypothetical protein BJ165DRAFT_1597466 [Panaeolus papilionaceus]
MSTATQEYKYIQVKGPLSITPVTPKEVKAEIVVIYILMGPTGSGKSSFIESLAPDQHLNIARDSLESVTQEVNCYQVVNLTYHNNHDMMMSEGRIMTMISECLDALRLYVKYLNVSILYFQPITDIRIGGSKRHSFKMLQAYVKLYNAQYLSVITTMWNYLSTPRQLEDANHRFERLQHEIYKSSDDTTIHVRKFDTSSKDSAYNGWIQRNEDPNTIMDPQYQALLCDNLLNRITNLLRQLQMIAEDKQTATSPGREDHCLLEVVLRDEIVALVSLQSFLDDLVDIGPSGMTALQSLLDACYEEDPSTCFSPWLPHVSHVALAWHRLHSLPVPTAPTTQHQTPSPVATFFAPIVASFQKRFNRTWK